MFIFQDPVSGDTIYLEEAIATACEGAIRGGGIFAFASRNGVDRLVSDPGFANFLASGHFDLIVGIDAVTTTSALDRLGEALTEFEGLSARVYLHDGRWLFHPKFCWFATESGATMIVGSGNLTPGGLRGNWEAFAVLDLGVTEFQAVEGRWNAWQNANQQLLRSLNDEEVRARAALNRVSYHGGPRTVREQVPLGGPNLQSVLIAEIPRGGNRWQQGNFSKHVYTDYFGADLETSQRLLLTWLDETGNIVTQETRATVSRKSHNYGFELALAAGLEYPSGDERPIAVFLKTAPRTFNCMLYMPTSPDYATVGKILEDHGGEYSANRMRRLELSHVTFADAWPDSPLLRPVGPAGEDEVD